MINTGDVRRGLYRQPGCHYELISTTYSVYQSQTSIWSVACPAGESVPCAGPERGRGAGMGSEEGETTHTAARERYIYYIAIIIKPLYRMDLQLRLALLSIVCTCITICVDK